MNGARISGASASASMRETAAAGVGMAIAGPRNTSPLRGKAGVWPRSTSVGAVTRVGVGRLLRWPNVSREPSRRNEPKAAAGLGGWGLGSETIGDGAPPRALMDMGAVRGCPAERDDDGRVPVLLRSDVGEELCPCAARSAIRSLL